MLQSVHRYVFLELFDADLRSVESGGYHCGPGTNILKYVNFDGPDSVLPVIIALLPKLPSSLSR